MQHVLARARHARRVHSVTDLIGNTPLVRVRTIERDLPGGVQICAKLESFNPGGSVKDRAVWQMIRDAVHTGDLTREKTLIDASRGNAAVPYAMIGAALGYTVHLAMPENASQRRRAQAEAFGAKIILTNPDEQIDGAIREVRRLVEADRKAGTNALYYPDQYTNPSNPKAHFQTTAPEIWTATDGRITHFVSGMSTSGTIMGTGRRLKLYNPAIEVIGVESLDRMPSTIIPEIFAPEELDRHERIAPQASLDMIERLSRDEGIFVGPSGGAAMVAAVEVAKTLESGLITVLLTDRDTY